MFVDRYHKRPYLLENHKSVELKSCIQSLRECITFLDKDHESLVGVLLKVDWTRRESGCCPRVSDPSTQPCIRTHILSTGFTCLSNTSCQITSDGCAPTNSGKR
ncbi:uncharacterized protein LOC117345281 [Pecten maximus]|uniref:uncharacterized protein LOC117345281 n=1 Tax=Pecten maximus TaxID=6579 RepID=UPI001458D355|nr:uncharacterized protein LOC117345281 [Pecten maximus]